MAATAGSAAVATFSTQATGTVRWFSHKGFGFIARSNDQDVYVHHSAIVGNGFRTLPAGARVEFRVVQTDRGPEAIEVVAADADADDAG